MTKKILKISAVVLFILVLGLLYYYFFFAKGGSNNPGTGNAPGFGNLFPFGQNNSGNSNQPTNTNDAPETNQPFQTGSYLQKLRLITNEPVAGAKFIEDKTGVYIRYMEKATGHIYNVATFSENVSEISNTTIPQIYEANFTEKGNSFIARYVKDDNETIETLYGKIATPSTSSGQAVASSTPTNIASSTQTTVGILLPENIESLSVSPSGTNIFYIQKSASGSTGIIATPSGGGRKQIWDSKIRSVLPQFAGENQILITTKPNASINGYAYIVDTKTGAVKNVLANIPDLSVLANPAGTALLFYTSVNNGELFVYSISNASTTQITPTTFPEKCLFDPSNKNILYCAVSKNSLGAGALDNWYLGLQSFSDDIWKYDLTAGTSSMLEDLKLDSGRDIDAINLQINSASSLLLFQSKTDGSLWSLNVSGN